MRPQMRGRRSPRSPQPHSDENRLDHIRRRLDTLTLIEGRGGTLLVPQIMFNRREDFMLARFFGDVELGEAPIGEPDVRDDRAVGVVVKVKKGTGPILERAGSALAQFAEGAKLV